MKTERLLPLILPLATLPGQGAQASVKATPQKPNILLILVDDLGWGDLSCQYADDMHTPNIDALFTSGVRMDNFYANSNVSSPSRAALLTGRFPSMVGVPGVIRTTPPDTNWGFFDTAATTLPQVLGENGYSTSLIGKWHLGLTSPSLPNERGFEYFHGYLGDMMDDYFTHRRHGNNYMFENDVEIDPAGIHATELFSDWAIEKLNAEAGSDKPFFMYLAYNAPHAPLQPPTEWLDKVRKEHPGLEDKRQRLVALIEHMDYNVGRVLNALDESGQRENTLVIFASDNGGDRGSMANCGPVRGYKGDMFEGGLRVVCAFNMPGVYEGGRSVGNFMMLMDIFPTLCDYLGIRTRHEMDGISVLKAINGKRQNTENRYIYWMRYEGGKGFDFGREPQTAVRYKGWKLLRNKPIEEQQMFHLSEDLKEERPVPMEGKIFRDLDAKMQNHYKVYIDKYGKF